MSISLKLTFVVASLCLLAGCAEHPQSQQLSAGWPNPRRLQHVRTTAYSRGEDGGRRNAVGKNLARGKCRSAASDWSRFPLGTRFRIVGTNEEYIIDDYGTALIGTNTIDLYKHSRLEMRRWGVRHVDIDILEWGSEVKSLQVLTPRNKHPSVRRMIVALQKKAAPGRT
ncbi:MAG TPA: 3D domain-containing protein, partial [Chthoniobacterales bacterium]